MPLPASEKALRRAIADLARLHSGDRAKVLETLTPELQRTAKGLLAEYQGAPVPARRAAVKDVSTRKTLPLSPWLLDMVSPARSDGSEVVHFQITPATRDALAQIAGRIAQPAEEPGPKSPTWRGLLADLIPGRLR